jgi:NAD(P)-dependent dehydrogenase (short-subunit alcohol dehydrogenase family)
LSDHYIIVKSQFEPHCFPDHQQELKTFDAVIFENNRLFVYDVWKVFFAVTITIQEERQAMAEKGIFDLSGKAALITGASRGLGRAFAEAMAEYGADVACLGRDEDKLAETVQFISQYRHKAVVVKADVSREDEIIKMVDEVVRKLGKIDILFNNAGVGIGPVKIHEMPVAEWDRVINTNLRGMFMVMKYVLPVMLKNKKGSIINISSIAGLRAEVPEVAGASYGASKAAIMNLTQVAAMEYAHDGIRVNCIAPGMHKSDLGSPKGEKVDPEMASKRDQFVQQYCAAWIPMGRQAEAAELKGLAVLLASDASSYITGQIFVQDGGQSARL